MESLQDWVLGVGFFFFLLFLLFLLNLPIPVVSDTKTWILNPGMVSDWLQSDLEQNGSKLAECRLFLSFSDCRNILQSIFVYPKQSCQVRI